jgi:hypothetical protein
MKSNYRELVEIAKTYSYSEILQPVGFVVTRKKASEDGNSTVSCWENKDLGHIEQIITESEDKDCYFTSAKKVDDMTLNKFELLKLLHAKGDWAVVTSMLENRTVTRKHPLIDIGLLHLDSRAVNSEMSLQSRIETDPHFGELVKRKVSELEVTLTAKRQLDEAESLRNAKALLQLGDEEFKERIGLVDWKKIWDLPSEIDWCVPGLISFGRGHLIYGQSGMGKSLFVEEIAGCAAAGKSILGFPPIEPIRVLYLDNENTPLGDVKPRFQDMGFLPHELENLIYLSFPEIPNLNSEEGGEVFTQLLERFQPRLVILDTFSRFVQGDENTSSTVQEFYEWSGKVMKKMGIAYIRIDHMGKDPEKQARGSSAKRDDVDLIWLMKEISPNSRFELVNEKSRVPLLEKRMILDRTTKPLSHRILSGIDWISLIHKAASADKALEFVKQYAKENPTSRLGRTAVWDALKPKCVSEGIDRKTLWDSIERYRQGDSYSENFEEIPIEN